MPFATQPILDSLVAYLSNDTTVTATVASRIYDTVAPQDPTLPLLIVSIVANPVDHYFSGEALKCDFQIDCFGKLTAGVKPARQLGDTVYASLDRKTNMTISGYAGVSMYAHDGGAPIDLDFVAAGITQQDAARDTRTYRLWGTAT